jgi:hypothetical protein
LIAVSKTKPIEAIMEAYDAGLRIFGENKAQELAIKQKSLPDDIQWHMIGHLQRNKVKLIAPFVHLIHSVDSLRLLREINKHGQINKRTINCLLQIYIAAEESKFGFNEDELLDLIKDSELATFNSIKIQGLMGMATFTNNLDEIRIEFRNLKNLFDRIKTTNLPQNINMQELSMGMTNDYTVAIEEGSTMIRIGTAIFGERTYKQ